MTPADTDRDQEIFEVLFDRCPSASSADGFLFERAGAAEADVYRRPVESSLIRSVGYDIASSVLEVEFVAGHVYEYYDVPLSIYSELMSAESKGSYFNDHIKDMYSYQQLD